jgi:putative ubiquitin-RnfH superfamily antitoxin RatB of RatAB toxin-antitoxin module
MRIEVVYALPEAQERWLLDLPPQSTVQDAIRSSGLIERHPEIQLGQLGIWGRPVTPETRLRDRDRVEIYRPLIADSKEARRKRAARERK